MRWCYCQCYWLDMMLMLKPLSSNDKKVTLLSFQSSWSYECGGTTDDAIGITWHWCQMCHRTKRFGCTSFWSFWPEKCNGTINNAIGIMWCWHWCHWHNVKSVAPHFDLDPRNAVVPLTMPLASYKTDSDGIGVTWTKNSFSTSFWSSWCKECNGAIDKAIGFTWCSCWS